MVSNNKNLIFTDMKPTQLLIILLLFPLSGFTQSAWDYDSLPKRNPNDLGFMGYSQHITDYYSLETNENGRKIKAYYFMGNGKKRDLFDCLGNIPTHTEYYDTLGRKIKQVLVNCHQTLHYNKTVEKITYYTYQELDSFLVVISITQDSTIERTPYSEKYSTNDILPDTTLLFFDKQTGYLSKETSPQNNYTVRYTYDELERLKTVNYPAQDKADKSIEYRYSYRYDTLEKDTIILSVGIRKVYLTDKPVIIYDDITYTSTRYYFVKGTLICECSDRYPGSGKASIRKRFWWLYGYWNQTKEYKNRICKERELETLYYKNKPSRRLRKRQKYEYY